MKDLSLQTSAVNHYALFVENGGPRLKTQLKTVFSFEEEKDVEIVIKHSEHSRKRASQRSLSPDAIMNVLLYGTIFFRQGMTFYAIKEKDIPQSLDHSMAEKMKNLVVALGDNTNNIVTCYYANNAFKYLKHKGKQLK